MSAAGAVSIDDLLVELAVAAEAARRTVEDALVRTRRRGGAAGDAGRQPQGGPRAEGAAGGTAGTVVVVTTGFTVVVVTAGFTVVVVATGFTVVVVVAAAVDDVGVPVAGCDGTVVV